MGKKSKSISQKPDAAQSHELPFLGGSAAIDAGLASLFEQSVRIFPVQSSSKLTYLSNYRLDL